MGEFIFSTFIETYPITSRLVLIYILIGITNILFKIVTSSTES